MVDYYYKGMLSGKALFGLTELYFEISLDQEVFKQMSKTYIMM